MFLDCCRLQDPIKSPSAAVLCGGVDKKRFVKWGVGNAAEEGMQAFEVAGPPARGAFSMVLVEALRSERDPTTKSLSMQGLKAFVAKKMETLQNKQSPTFDFNPKKDPGPFIFPAVAAAAFQPLTLDLSGLPAGVTVRLSDTDLNPIAGFAAIPSGAAPVVVPNLPPGFYMVQRSDLADEDAELFTHPRKKAFRVQ